MAINATWTLQLSWPAALLPADPPSLEDAQAAPTAIEMLPQVLSLTPRGQAWGTDEVGSADGVSPVMAQFWTAIAKWVVDLNVREAEVFFQAFPSAVTIALADWEAELGLPDRDTPLAASTGGRLATVRIRAAALAADSPADFIGAAAAVGASITIEEPDQFQVDFSEVGPSFDAAAPLPADLAALDMVADVTAWRFWIVRIVATGPFASAAEIERAIRPFAPTHTSMVFA